MEQREGVADNLAAAMIDIAEKVSGTINITKKQNGIMISIFMPYAEKPKRKTVTKPYDERDVLIARHLSNVINTTNPGVKIPFRESSWAQDIHLLRKDYSDEQIISVVKHTYMNEEDTFWRNKVLSARKFREKFATIAAQMSNPKKSSWV